MMGRTHALSGPVLALAAVPVVNMVASYFGAPLAEGTSIAVMAVAAAGGAMLPDFDHQHASIAQSVGPVTKTLAKVVGAISGGHRNGTHSLLGVVAFTAATWGLAQWNTLAFGVWIAFLFAVASAAMRLTMSKSSLSHIVVCLAVGTGLIAYTSSTYIPAWAVTYGVAVGCVAHILGDMLTKQGCPLLWPFSPTRSKFLALTTGGDWEKVYLFWLLNIALVGLSAYHLGLLERLL